MNIHKIVALAKKNKYYLDRHTDNRGTFNDKDYIIEISEEKFGLWKEGGSCINTLLVKNGRISLSKESIGGYYGNSYDLRKSFSHTVVLPIA